jgi:hypothetical protein
VFWAPGGTLHGAWHLSHVRWALASSQRRRHLPSSCYMWPTTCEGLPCRRTRVSRPVVSPARANIWHPFMKSTGCFAVHMAPGLLVSHPLLPHTRAQRESERAALEPLNGIHPFFCCRRSCCEKNAMSPV